MTKCEVIDLTLSDSDSDGDFIQAKKVIHPFLYEVSIVHQVSVYYIKFLYTTLSFYYIKFLLQRKLFHRTRACT